MNPGTSFCRTTGRLPALLSSWDIVATVSSDVSGPLMISTSGIKCGGLM